ncbi:hypothetical protein M5D96_009363, partial [Drosophila gunungcola]
HQHKKVDQIVNKTIKETAVVVPERSGELTSPLVGCRGQNKPILPCVLCTISNCEWENQFLAFLLLLLRARRRNVERRAEKSGGGTDKGGGAKRERRVSAIVSNFL